MCQCHPQPHALHNALPGRHQSPLSPTQAHRLRGPWSPGLGGERQFTGKVPIKERRPLGQRSCSLHSKASWPERALGLTDALCPCTSKADSGALRESKSCQERRTQRPPQCPCPTKQLSTRILLTYQGPRGLRGEGGRGLALTEEERLNVRLRRLRRRCFLRLLRWLR